MESVEECGPSLRLCEVGRPLKGSCGFHLSRTQWDPYPWISGVEPDSAAESAGLQVGDCVLEVNGEDVLGQKIGEVAKRVRSKSDKVTLLLWNPGSDSSGTSCVAGNGPTPLNLQRLSGCIESVLQLLECPVCLETIPPPAFQCYNGHVLCGGCRARAEKCPICRVVLGPRGRCLLADKLYRLLKTTFIRYEKSRKSNRTGNADVQQPQLVHLKSRLLLQSAAIPEEIISSKDAKIKTEDKARAVNDMAVLNNVSRSANKHKDSQMSFYCPFGPKCTDSIREDRFLHHVLERHPGPLVQYFVKPFSPITINFSFISSVSSCLVSLLTAEGLIFFLQHVQHSGQRLLWSWLLGNQALAERHHLKIKLPGGEIQVGPVFPLTASWDDVIGSQRCLTLDRDKYPADEIQIQIEITEKTGDSKTRENVEPAACRSLGVISDN